MSLMHEPVGEEGNIERSQEEMDVPVPSTAQPSQETHHGFRVRSREELWIDSDDVMQSRLNKGFSANLHFNRQVNLSPIDIIEALAANGFTSDHVRALQRSQPGVYTVTFKSEELKESFLENSTFKVLGFAPLIQDTRAPLTFVSIRYAPPELPDAAIIARLKCYGDVLTFRRGKHRDTDIENGVRTVRMRLHRPIPSYIRIASESLLILYEGQTRTCRRCNRTGHEARTCSSYACYNCDELGHVASACDEPTKCSICKSIAHKAGSCPYAVIDELDSDIPISAVLADALLAVPTVPTAENTDADEDPDGLYELADADTLARLTTQMSPALPNSSDSSADTVQSSKVADPEPQPPPIPARKPRTVDAPPNEKSEKLPSVALPRGNEEEMEEDNASVVSQGSKRHKDPSSDEETYAVVAGGRRKTAPQKPYSGRTKKKGKKVDK